MLAPTLSIEIAHAHNANMSSKYLPVAKELACSGAAKPRGGMTLRGALLSRGSCCSFRLGLTNIRGDWPRIAAGADMAVPTRSVRGAETRQRRFGPRPGKVGGAGRACH
jgi:hypothetical protein